MNGWKLPWDGGCRCGQTRIRVSASPLLTAACHCTGCQRMSASAFSLGIGIPSEGFDVTQGEPVIGGLHGPTRHFFCPRCMSWDVYAARGHERVRQSTSFHAGRSQLDRSVHRSLDPRKAALGKYSGSAQLCDSTRFHGLSQTDRRVRSHRVSSNLKHYSHRLKLWRT